VNNAIIGEPRYGSVTTPDHRKIGGERSEFLLRIVASIRIDQLEAKKRWSSRMIRPVLERIRGWDLKTSAPINRGLGNSFILSQENTALLFRFARRRLDR